MTAATITAASSARAERAEKRVSSVKLPSNPFAGKQYLGLILPLALIALWVHSEHERRVHPGSAALPRPCGQRRC